MGDGREGGFFIVGGTHLAEALVWRVVRSGDVEQRPGINCYLVDSVQSPGSL